MRKCTLLVSLCLLCLAIPIGSSFAAHIGLYADPEGLSSEIIVREGTPTIVYFIVHAPEFPDGILGAEFSVPGWPTSDLDCVIGLNWPGASTIGDIATGIGIVAGAEPWIWPIDERGNRIIGTASFCAYDDNWLDGGNYFEFEGYQRPWETRPPLLVDTEFITHDIEGDSFTFVFLRTPVERSTISLLKALY